PQLIHHVRKEYDSAGPRIFEGGNAFYKVSEIFEHMLKDKLLKKTTIIIDALDECETERDSLLKFISRLASNIRTAKWLVSSRNIREIERNLEIDGNGNIVRLEVSGNATNIAEGVDAYIDSKISKVEVLKEDNDKR